MRIKDIQINNFQGIKYLQLKPEHRVSVILGQNGKGKSSVLRAIRYGFTGEAPDDMIRKGETFASVDIELDTGDMFERAKTNKGQKIRLNGAAVTNKNLMETLEGISGASKEAMKIISSKQVFEALKPDQLSSFLLDFIPEEMNADKVVSFVPLLPATILNELRALLPAMPETFGLDTIEAAHESISEKRKFLKRDMDFTLKSIEKLGIPYDGVLRTKEEIEKDKQDVIKKKAEQDALKKTYAIYESARKKAAEQTKTIAAYEERLKKYEKITKPSEKRKAELEDVLEKSKVNLQNINNNINNMKTKLVEEMEMLNVLKAKNCPLCEEVTCPVDKELLIEACAERIESYKEGISLQEDAKKTAAEAVVTAQNNVNIFKQAEMFYAEKVKIMELIHNLKSTLVELPSISETTPELDKHYDEELKKLQEEMKIVETERKRTELLAQHESLKANWEVANVLVEQLRPKGEIVNQILAYYYKYFEEACATVSEKLIPGFKIAFANEDGIRLWVTPGNGKDCVPYQSLSSGEKVLASFVVLDMLNQLTGFNILLLDDIEHLDIKTFETFLKFVIEDKSLGERYDHIVIAGAIHEDISAVVSKFASEIDLISM